MPISPTDLLELAAELLQTDSETHHRAAASRAYYAAFHRCNLLPLSPPATRRRGGMHARLIQEMRRFRSDNAGLQAELRSLAELLKKARDLRTNADYRLDDRFSAKTAQLLVSLAGEIVRRAEAAVLSAQ